MSKLALGKKKELEIKLPKFAGWITETAREFEKNIYLCFINCTKAFDCMDHNKLLKVLKEMGLPDQLTCLLRNLNAEQEATVKTGHGTVKVKQKSLSHVRK